MMRQGLGRDANHCGANFAGTVALVCVSVKVLHPGVPTTNTEDQDNQTPRVDELGFARVGVHTCAFGVNLALMQDAPSARLSFSVAFAVPHRTPLMQKSLAGAIREQGRNLRANALETSCNTGVFKRGCLFFALPRGAAGALRVLRVRCCVAAAGLVAGGNRASLD